MAFNGTFDHTLDAKNRLTVPSKFRTALAGDLFLVKGAEPCLSLYPAATYRRFADAALDGLNPLSAEYKRWSRYFFHNALGTELDGAGRLTLPKEFREAAGIDSRNVMIAGAGQCLELWDPERLRGYDADQIEHPPDLPASLGHPA